MRGMALVSKVVAVLDYLTPHWDVQQTEHASGRRQRNTTSLLLLILPTTRGANQVHKLRATRRQEDASATRNAARGGCPVNAPQHGQPLRSAASTETADASIKRPLFTSLCSGSRASSLPLGQTNSRAASDSVGPSQTLNTSGTSVHINLIDLSINTSGFLATAPHPGLSQETPRHDRTLGGGCTKSAQAGTCRGAQEVCRVSQAHC
jgi:hypothetical protein